VSELPLTAWLLEQETHALLDRLDRVKPFVLHETMLPAAAPTPAALVGIEQFLFSGRRELRERILAYRSWLRAAGSSAAPAELQRRFTALRWRFNDVLNSYDLFHEAITQRSEREVGVWLAGLDIAAADALAVPGRYFEPPPIICYLDRGPGAAIRRARTRMPGGGLNPVAITRIPRERMIGYGIASSLVHEVGHQAAALLDLVESLGSELRSRPDPPGASERAAWALWRRWISEIAADFWAVGKLGITATLGLMGVLSLPRGFVFRVDADDPHPVPWMRVKLSAALGDHIYPHPQWREVADVWSAFYPIGELDDERRDLLAALEATAPELVALLADHRPPRLRGASLCEVMPAAERTPERLAEHFNAWTRRPELMNRAPPTLAFAVLGQARAAGLLAPEAESPMLDRLLIHWALTSTLAAAEAGAACTHPETTRIIS
jgi:hypothetical protein